MLICCACAQLFVLNPELMKKAINGYAGTVSYTGPGSEDWNNHTFGARHKQVGATRAGHWGSEPVVQVRLVICGSAGIGFTQLEPCGGLLHGTHRLGLAYPGTPLSICLKWGSIPSSFGGPAHCCALG